MDLKKLAETLQDAEIAILKGFGKTHIEIMNNLKGLSKVEFMRAGMWLQNKGLIETKKTAKKIVTLDTHGKKYAKTMLPELKLLNLIQKQDMSIEELQQKMPKDELRFAIGYLKKKDCVKFEQGIVSITTIGKRLRLTPEGALLLKLAKLGETALSDLTDEELESYKALAKRKQVVKTLDKQTINFKITAMGKQILSHLPMGKRISNLTPQLLKTGQWKDTPFRRFDVEARVPDLYFGKKQPYNQWVDQLRDKLVQMGFKEMTGPLIETEFWNYDALYVNQTHPARIEDEAYKLKFPKKGVLPKFVQSVKAHHETGGKTRSKGWQYKWNPELAARLMPRPQGTALSARQLAKGVEVPGKYFATARCYRPDVLDATHLIEFNQIEGIIIGKDLTFKNLLGILKQFAIDFAGTDKIRFLADYYPFTEPSVQLDFYSDSLGKWVEFGGAGIFRPELTAALGIKEPVIAWGLGLDRFAMSKLGINDIRYLFSYDLNWLRKEKTI